ncbi:MAG TPA: type VI secretion system tip protein TssI/VgrG [Caulobacteraceae bacterium]|nr:type VI secretion system tip protein TssI/VgrG [Caulobacteraceae bacterium]
MPTGDTRDAVITLPIPGKVAIERFETIERLSEPFVISVLVLSDDFVDFFPHLGAAVGIKVSHEGETVRAFHGLLFEADYIGESGAGHRYHLTLRPWLHVLSRNLDYSIFQEKSTVDIVKAVFETRGCSDVDYSKLSGTYAPRDYCVQYRESDFAFVSRLMEEDGIYYYFRHAEDRHTLVLCDGRASHEEADYSSLPFASATGAILLPGETRLQSDRMWLWNERVATGAEGDVKLRNFDFERPATPREGSYGEGEKLAVEKAEVYDFPARFLEPDDGKALGQTILQSARRQRQAYVGEGDATGLFCGALVKLARHPVTRLNQDYLVCALRYSLETQSYRSGAASAPVSPSLVALEAIPADTPWKAPIVNPRPVARGPETAIVTGPEGETIYTDKYGRVKVRFHWDRSNSSGEKTTCFIRVSHNSAGAEFGNIILPRLGQEVIVDFLDGDPDRPIITGRVYNAAEMPPYTLPDKKNLSVWRSETIGTTGPYEGGETPPSGQAFNEISMDDTGGTEQLYVRAQRDAVTMVYNDHKYTVQRDETGRVGRDRATNIKNNETFTVEQGERKSTIQKNESLTVVQGDMSTTVSQGNKTAAVKMGNYSVDVALGNYSLKTDAGAVSVEAMQKISLKVGQNSIVIDQTGVTISALMVSITAQVSLQAKGLMTDVEGSAMTTVKGGIVMIN